MKPFHSYSAINVINNYSEDPFFVDDFFPAESMVCEKSPETGHLCTCFAEHIARHDIASKVPVVAG